MIVTRREILCILQLIKRITSSRSADGILLDMLLLAENVLLKMKPRD